MAVRRRDVAARALADAALGSLVRRRLAVRGSTTATRPGAAVTGAGNTTPAVPWDDRRPVTRALSRDSWCA